MYMYIHVQSKDDDDYKETTLHFTEKICNYDDIASRILTKKEERKKKFILAWVWLPIKEGLLLFMRTVQCTSSN